MRNLKLQKYTRREALPGGDVETCLLCENSSNGELYAVCGRSLFRYGNDGTPTLLKDELFDMDEDAVVSFDATFNGFCATSKLGQIVTFKTDSLPEVETVGDIFGGLGCAAWSPDQELLCIITNNGQLLVMGEDFNCICEQSVDTEDLGEKSAITVGWGKKETQFHGSEGKKAAKTVAVERNPVADFDEGKPRIVWRNDGQYFATNTVHNNVRTLRIWNREGVLQYTAEDIAFLHDGLCWWTGDESLIVGCDTSVQNERRIIFYETNGLRHGQFKLPFNYVVKSIRQSTTLNPRILTVLCEADDSNVLLVYTMNNYHWYPKQTMVFKSKIRSFFWDSTERLHLLSDQLYTYKWIYEVDSSGSGMVASIDDTNLLVTNLDKFLIPPPMAQITIATGKAINAVVLLKEAILMQLACGDLVVSRNGVISTPVPSTGEYRLNWLHFTTLSETEVVAVTHHDGLYRLVKITVQNDLSTSEIIDLPETPECIAVHRSTVYVKLENIIIQKDLAGGSETPTVETPTLMQNLEMLQCTPQGELLGFNSSQRLLYFQDRQICTNATSFVVHGETFVLVTTLDNFLLCYPIFGSSSFNCCDRRNLEIGSVIVTSVPVDGRVVLQMPRGNLETIYPRPLMLHAIQEHLRLKEYSEALRLMRVNRINMNLLYDHDPDSFEANVELMVRKINDVNHLNLFVTELSEEDMTKSMYVGYYSLLEMQRRKRSKSVGTICDYVRAAVTAVDEERLLMTVMTCYAKKNTIEDLENALLTAHRFLSKFDEAVKYLALLVDVNKLMDVALGSYDFKIFLKVAQHSQKDPKEYLAQLNELKAFEDDNYRKFKIDHHLKRFERALLHISKCPEKFEECLQLIVTDRLFSKANCIFPPDSKEAKSIWAAHGDYLLTKKYYKDAALSYLQAEEYIKASQCFERAMCLELCLDSAEKAKLELLPIARRLVFALISEKKHSEAALLMRRYSFGVEDVCTTLIDGQAWVDAFCCIKDLPADVYEFFKSHLDSALLSSAQDLSETVAGLSIKLSNYVDRLDVVREEKAQRKDDYINFYDDTDLPMSEAGSMISGGSRGARSHRSGSSKSGSLTTVQSNRQMRKARKPKYTLKEGSPFEDLAIIQECAQLITQVSTLADQVASLITGLQLVSRINEGSALQTMFSKLYGDIRNDYMAHIWPEVHEGETEVISDAELRIRPTLSDVKSSAMYADRW